MVEIQVVNNCEIDSDNNHIIKKSLSDEFYEALINEAPNINGDSCALTQVAEIPWINPSLIKQGLEFIHRNSSTIRFANTTALLFGLAVRSESVVALRMGKFYRDETTFAGLLSVISQMQNWYDDDMLADNSMSYRTCRTIRRVHAYFIKFYEPLPTLKELRLVPEKSELSQAMRADLEFLDVSEAPVHLLTWTPKVEISQFDMVLTQYGFIGGIYMFPNMMGINADSSQEGINGFIHFWAVIGRLLGIEDRFNLALNSHCDIYQKLFKNIVLPSLKNSDLTVTSLQKAFVDGLSEELPFLSLKAWIYFGLKESVTGYQGRNIYQIMTFRDKICLIFLLFGTRMRYYCRTLSWFVSQKIFRYFKWG